MRKLSGSVGIKHEERAKCSSTTLLHPILLLAYAYLASPRRMKKFYAFLLLQRFLPGIQSHKSSGRKHVTGPQLPLELRCPNFSQSMVPQSRTGGSTVLGARGERSMCSPWSWLKHRTEPGSGPQCQGQAYTLVIYI